MRVCRGWDKPRGSSPNPPSPGESRTLGKELRSVVGTSAAQHTPGVLRETATALYPIK